MPSWLPLGLELIMMIGTLVQNNPSILNMLNNRVPTVLSF